MWRSSPRHEGFSHVHFHVVPRMADQPADRRGPAVFGYLTVAPDERVPAHRMDELAVELTRRLAG
jgi:diadenosine tetraphosphate (Ap4A) HIT family hydrolase